MAKNKKDGKECRLVLDDESAEIVRAYSFVYRKTNKEISIIDIIKKFPKHDHSVFDAMNLTKDNKQ